MKKYNLFFYSFLIITTLLISNVYAGGYLAITGGGGGEAKAGSWGIEGGWIRQHFLLGLGFSVTSEYNDKIISGKRHFEQEVEGYGAVGMKIIPTLFLVGTAGYSEVESNVVVPSLWGREVAGGVIRSFFTSSGQLQYNMHEKLIIGAGYHNRRGVVGRIGFRF